MSTITTKTKKTEAPSRLRSRIRIGPGSAGRLMTPEQFDALRPEQFIGKNRYELINGVLVVSPRAGIGERNPNDELGYSASDSIEIPIPRLSSSTEPCRSRLFPRPTAVWADRVIWTGLGRTPNEKKDIPSIVIEFVSKRRRDALRDYETKRDEYLAAGVQQYWIIDRFRRVMTSTAWESPDRPTKS